jgi:hypothetical protein
MKAIARVSLAVPVLLLTGACNRADQPARTEGTGAADRTQETAFVRFIDAHTGNAALYFGDEQVLSGTGDKITDYKQLPAERRQFALRAAGQPDGDALATNSEGLGSGKRYTVVAFNDGDGKASLRVLNDDEDAPDTGKAKVRVIHASPEMEGLKLYAAGRKDEIASQSRFTTGSGWQEVEPVQGALEMRGTDRNLGTVRIPNVTLEAGKLYTFVVRRGEGAQGRPQVTPIIDTPRS